MAELSEARLIEKLRALEGLYARPGTTAEGQAAADAAERILQRLAEASGDDEPVEYRFSMPDMWSRRVFIALLRRHGIRPYRYRRQRYTTVMAKVSKRFVDDTLWPEYEAFSATLREYLGEVTDRIVSQVIHDDLTEAAVVEEPPQLTLGIDPGGNGSSKTAPKASQPKPPSPPVAGAAPPSAPESEATTTRGSNRERNKRKRKRKKRRR